MTITSKHLISSWSDLIPFSLLFGRSISMHSATEQTQYWMWTRRKFGGRPYIPSLTGTGIAAYNESWEERAFADDSSGRLGGCVWPPRSYSCSFCRREFRSAQALGGHMNVHRRDRARLKQSPPANLQENNTHLHTQPHHLHPNLCSPIMMCSPNPNHGVVASASTLSPSRVVSVASTPGNCIENTTLVSPSYFSSTNQGQQQRKTSFLHTHAVPAELKLGGQNLKIGDAYSEKRKEKSEERKDNIFSSSCKKQRRTDAAPSFLGQYLDGGLQSEVLVLDHVSVEELDLELRLGDRPKIN